MEYIKDQAVNSYDAEIIEELRTPEQRLEVVERVVNTMFKTTSSVEFHGLKEFDRMGTNNHLPPSIYWTYVFTVKGQGTRLQTVTLDNEGGMDFSFHRIFLSTFNRFMETK